MTGLYGVRDRVAGRMLGIFMVYSAAAAAVRWFGDVLSSDKTLPGTHPADFELCKYADYDDENDQLTAHERETVMTGAMWFAAQAPLTETDIRRVG